MDLLGDILLIFQVSALCNANGCWETPLFTYPEFDTKVLQILGGLKKLLYHIPYFKKHILPHSPQVLGATSNHRILATKDLRAF